MNAKTRARIDRIVKCVDPYLRTQHIAALTEIVEHELREQDRDTRHACAEAILTLDMAKGMFAYSPTEIRDRARAACINVQAI